MHTRSVQKVGLYRLVSISICNKFPDRQTPDREGQKNSKFANCYRHKIQFYSARPTSIIFHDHSSILSAAFNGLVRSHTRTYGRDKLNTHIPNNFNSFFHFFATRAESAISAMCATNSDRKMIFVQRILYYSSSALELIAIQEDKEGDRRNGTFAITSRNSPFDVFYKN